VNCFVFTQGPFSTPSQEVEVPEKNGTSKNAPSCGSSVEVICHPCAIRLHGCRKWPWWSRNPDGGCLDVQTSRQPKPLTCVHAKPLATCCGSHADPLRLGAASAAESATLVTGAPADRRRSSGDSLLLRCRLPPGRLCGVRRLVCCRSRATAREPDAYVEKQCRAPGSALARRRCGVECFVVAKGLSLPPQAEHARLEMGTD
jgi:hypothetical protein